jgi:hypothetical protein
MDTLPSSAELSAALSSGVAFVGPDRRKKREKIVKKRMDLI